ncbi:MAG: Signal transduction histidine kinase [Comamonadaceae bacterium CG_4_9_14_3_um_filter_60_33]|nr:MAG: Signal transduction histidine kinase [Comamonadaceae bacterium CG2_30_59_20]PIY30042.1 MAG: Signal transduction histidine kinase [Comamonadaceae bacterium CG_4_10_14_3_um_filter_60_42]PJB45509.1 MAG: Signal transduction histidine kinase [Comamonadaceae bacterium CG_4_9_14_3_um_filter_60_33]
MRIRSLLLILVIALITAFTVLNWNVFLANTTLSFGVTHLDAPLGLIMLGLLIFVVAYCLVYVLYLQSNVLIDTRRNAKELHTNRELADKAEASRLTELRGFVEAGLKQSTEQDKAAQQALLARLDALETSLRSSVEQSGNSLSAYIGELEDRLTPDKEAPVTLR